MPFSRKGDAYGRDQMFIYPLRWIFDFEVAALELLGGSRNVLESDGCSFLAGSDSA